MSHSSHQNATFPLARKLSECSVSVYYCGPSTGVDEDELKENVENQQFSYISLDPYCSEYCSDYTEDQISSIERRFECFLFNLQDGTLYDSFIKTYAPDLIIIDIHHMALALPFLPKGVPLLLASTKIGTDKDRLVPPLNSSIIPDEKLSTNKKIEKSWQTIREKNKGMSQYFEFLKQVAEERYQWNFDEYFYIDKCIVPFGFRLPELIFWDLEFDFPRTQEGLNNKFYLGNQVDISRMENIDGVSNDIGNEIIYVSLGTRWDQNIESRMALLKEIIIAAKTLPNYHFIVSVSDYRDRLYAFVESSNVTLLDFAPQLSILSKSVLMINHAGGNSVKECIRMGVPMLCYPLDNDQFGNAARVAYHKVGMRGKYTEKAEVIAENIERILVNAEFIENIKKFQLRAISTEKSEDDVQIIKSFL